MIAIAPFLRPLCVVSPLYLPFPDFGLQECEAPLKAHTEIPSKEKRRDSHIPPSACYSSPLIGDPPRNHLEESISTRPRYPVTVVAAANHLLDPQAPSTPGGSVPPPQHQNQQGQGTASSGCNWDPVVGPRPAPTYSVVNAIIEVKEDGPGSRCGHTLTAVAAVGEGTPGYIGPRLILFGAPQPSRVTLPRHLPQPVVLESAGLAGATADVHCYDVLGIDGRGLLPLGEPPSPRAAHVATAVGTMVVIQGGNALQVCQLRIFTFLDLTQQRQRWHIVQGPGPGPRYGHVMALVGQRFLLCIGGNDGRKRPLVDVWALDTAAKPYEWRKLEPEGEGPGPCISPIFSIEEEALGYNVQVLKKVTFRETENGFEAMICKLASLEENENLVLTPFEKNLDIWRQLWRVLERSDLLVMVVDARDPLFYYCPDLEEKWAEYFKANGILFIFWSAKAASAILEGKKLSNKWDDEQSADESSLSNPDTRIYGRDELLARLQAEAESVVSRKSTIQKETDGSFYSSESSAARSIAKQVVVGFVGYPNVGKSSTINALVGGKRTGVTSTPGKTKHFQTIIISNELILCDCPGLVFPSFSSSRYHMIASGVLPVDRMTDHREAVQIVANSVPRNVLEEIYNIKLPKPKPYEQQSRPPTAAELLRAYCSSRGHVSSSGCPMKLEQLAKF
ncbi:hypothetical protein HPP92_017120 [Vanilla planifolia]|uniref:G domain-containing protein n=1 Tax=Vanilla planifolia TaxID=51239 RepID=A0A835QET2_VANPL|nr:hypothetical protein HPP92_017120 [Vanilla planifolia]